jgi:hypothetical protein
VTRPRRSTRITRLHRYHGMVRPCSPHQYSTPCGSAAWGSPFHKRPRATTAPLAAPRTRDDRFAPEPGPSSRAAFMPDTAWAVNGYPPGSSRDTWSASVSMPSGSLSTRHRRIAFARLLGPHLTRSRRAFSATLGTPALDRRTLRWFAASPRRAAAEDHQPQEAGPSISDAAPHQLIRSPTSTLPLHSCSHTRSRSTSRSSSARRSHRTTSHRSTSASPAWSPSRTTTPRSHSRSTGPSPVTTSTPSSPESSTVGLAYEPPPNDQNFRTGLLASPLAYASSPQQLAEGGIGHGRAGAHTSFEDWRQS